MWYYLCEKPTISLKVYFFLWKCGKFYFFLKCLSISIFFPYFLIKSNPWYNYRRLEYLSMRDCKSLIVSLGMPCDDKICCKSIRSDAGIFSFAYTSLLGSIYLEKKISSSHASFNYAEQNTYTNDCILILEFSFALCLLNSFI